MPARDLFHNAVRHGLEKEGWLITDDPLSISFGGVDLYVDLGAERLIAAERGEEKIAVEIKSFLGMSVITEFHAALGQFLNYQLGLSARDPQRKLYLAVPDDTYNEFFKLEFTRLAVERYQLRLIVYEANAEVIVQWID